ncbi:PLAC8-domain-containing protein, partial [Artomyces pyxidatus]
MSNYPVNTQPQAMAPMQMLKSGDRNYLNKVFDEDGRREWSHWLCCCCGDCGACCLACWCPCILYGKNRQRLHHLQVQGFPRPDGGDSCNSHCWASCLLTSTVGCGWILNISLRSDIRARYRIRGSGCGDCCSSFWCFPCDLVQEHREIELEERSFGKQA